jgi:hypothetical protein
VTVKKIGDIVMLINKLSPETERKEIMPCPELFQELLQAPGPV